MKRQPTFPTRTCRLCGERFTPTNGRQRYCSVKHWSEHRRGAPTVRECRLCGQAFAPTSGNQRFCTREHRDQHYRAHRQPSNTAGWRERIHQLEAEVANVRELLDRAEAA
jgi:hypothetical protein